ncbi:MAG: NAD-dependent epimerase/dehydratase family protein [Elusimicrobiota bacterium]
MRIIILGASGMLGHQLWQYLSVRFPKTYATIRGCRDDYENFNLLKNANQVIENIDVLNFPNLEKVFGKTKPEVILNCIG